MTEDGSQPGPANYDDFKRRAAERNRRMSAFGRDIGKLPKVANPARREAARLDFRRFCDSYFGQRFDLPWSDDHVRVLAKTQTCVLSGGQFAEAMPRGSGKTSIVECGALWAILYGHRLFPVLIGATEAHGQELLESIVTEVEVNDVLAEDFPEVCVPIRRLDGNPQRCAGQLCEGERTLITWTDHEIVLPTIPGSAASGAIVKVAGLTGRIRGMKFTRPDGKSVRPDLAIVDDPQTDASASSLSECIKRERILAGAVLGLGGPGKKIAALMPCTVIRPGDVADNILDRQLHPEWNGERTKLVYQFPDDAKLWEQYADARAESLREHGDIRDATKFYREHRVALDKGAVVAWPQRYQPDEESAIQHAMNLRLANEEAFWAEMQNDPIKARDSVDDVGILSADEICRLLSGLDQSLVPLLATKLTAFIDVQQRLLYWMVVAWSNDFTGWIIDYGTEPEQTRERFTYADADRTLETLHKGMGLEDQLFQALQARTDWICGREWIRADGQRMRVARCLIDANWNVSTETVKSVCRRSAYAAKVERRRAGPGLMWSRGRSFGLSAKGIGDWARKPGDASGFGWSINAETPLEIHFDSGLWKTFVHSRLATKPLDPGSLSLWGKKPGRHRMLAEQLTSETRERLRGASRVVDVWTLQKHRDNHLLDTLVGCAVAASEQGAALRSMEAAARPERKRIKFQDRPM